MTIVANKSKMGEDKGNYDEHELFEKLRTCTNPDEAVGRIRDYFEVAGVAANIEDKSGMTPMMHACWKGNLPLARFLLSQGADVNAGSHEHDYTSLHFAALAGKPDVCRLLLDNGAKIDATNSVKRTASQMAAFVGNHECVAIMNNYVPKEDVYYYTRKQPLENEAKLPIDLAKPLHNLVMLTNTHPVRVGLFLRSRPEILDRLDVVARILDLMSDREFKNRRDVNEVLALKFHILRYIVDDVRKNCPPGAIDRWIRAMVANPRFQDNFLRQAIKEFAFQESQLFKMLVANFGHNGGGGEQAAAADCINQAFNGQRGFRDDDACAACASEGAQKKCSACKSASYCDQTCQKMHWPVHKAACASLKEQWEKRQQEASKNEEEKNNELQ